jgi:hypothetical protein
MPRRAWLAAALVTGALVRAALLPSPGSPDVPDWKIWAFAASTDATSLYGVGGHPPEHRLMHWQGETATTDYPPLALYELALVGRAYAAIDPTFAPSTTLTVFVKLPGLLAEIAFVVFLLTWGRRRFGEAAAAWGTVAFWLNPAVIVDGAALGYLDAQMAVPAAMAVMLAAAGEAAPAGALLAVAVLTKAQAIFAAPAVLVAVVAAGRARLGRPQGAAPTGDVTKAEPRAARTGDVAKAEPRAARTGDVAATEARGAAPTGEFATAEAPRGGVAAGVLRFAVGGLAATTAAVLPIVLRGAWPNMVQALGRLGTHDMVSGQALNVWWIVTWIARSLDSLDMGWRRAFTEPVRILAISRFVEVGYPNPRPIGVVLVAAAILWACWRMRRARSLAAWTLTAGWCAYAYAMLGAQVHENHFYLAVPLLVVAAAADARLRAASIATSLMVAFNLYVFYGFGTSWSPALDRGWTGVDLTVVAAAVNVGLFAWLTRCLVRRPSP